MSADVAAHRALAPVKWFSYAVIGVSVIVLIRSLPLGEGVAAVKSTVEGLGVWGPVVFGLIYIVAVVAMLPASLLTLAGGATFGLLIGTVTVSVASNIGAALAFLIARYLARSRVEQFASERPRFAAIDRAIDEGGWKIVAMLRLSPLVPFNVQNYLYGLTSIGFWTCVLTSLVAMLPGTFLYVYLGHAAGSVTGAEGGRTPGEWALLGVGLMATIGVTVYITRLAQRKLREQTAIRDDTPTETVDPSADADLIQDSQPQSSTTQKSVLIPAALAILLASFAAVTSLRPELVEGLASRLLRFGPPAVQMTEQYEDQPGGLSFDHSAFDQVLRRHVDPDGWVDYTALKQDAAKLDHYLQSIADAPFAELGRDAKLALLINAYNAATLRLILDHWPLESIKDISAADRWTAKRWNVAGGTFSLEQIEHELIRPNFKEPRIHFALVCAAVGCPPLRNEAYTAEQLEARLDEQARYVHAHGTWFMYDEQRQIAKLTSLYDWYAGDFAQSAGSVLEFVARYNPQVRDRLESHSAPQIAWLPYDWSINDVSNRQPR